MSEEITAAAAHPRHGGGAAPAHCSGGRALRSARRDVDLGEGVPRVFVMAAALVAASTLLAQAQGVTDLTPGRSRSG